MTEQESGPERGIGTRDMVSAWVFYAALFAALMLLSGPGFARVDGPGVLAAPPPAFDGVTLDEPRVAGLRPARPLAAVAAGTDEAARLSR